MIEGRFDTLLAYAAELEGFSGYLDGDDLKAQQAVRNEYTQARNNAVYGMLQDMTSEEACDLVRKEMAEVARQNPDWEIIAANVEQDLLERLHQQQRRHPLLRTITHFALPGLLAIGLITYFGIWFYNDLDVDEPIETRAGIVQRAAAYEKARNYEEMAPTSGRRRFLASLLVKPWEPDDGEYAGAAEFVDLVVSGVVFLNDERLACGPGYITNVSQVGEAHLGLSDDMAEFVQSDTTEWVDPELDTILIGLAGRFPCSTEGAVDTES